MGKGGAVEAFRSIEALVGQEHRVGFIDENGHFPFDLAGFKKGANWLGEN